MSLHYASEEMARRFPRGESVAFAREGDALLREQRADEALSLLQEGVKRFPGYLPGFLVLGRAYKDAGRIAEAKSEFENALRLDGRCPAALSLLAWIEETQKESDESANHLSALAEQEPWDEDFQKAAHRTPPAPAAPAKAAPIFARVDHFAEAPAKPSLSNPAPSLSPDSPANPSSPPPSPLPVTRKTLEDEDFEEDEDGENSPPHVATVTLAEIYFQQGLKEQALQIYRQLLERQPDNETVKKRLREIEASMASSAP